MTAICGFSWGYERLNAFIMFEMYLSIYPSVDRRGSSMLLSEKDVTRF